MAERKSPPIHPTYYFESGLEYILNHFQGDLWPRTKSTKATVGAQIPVRSKEESLKWFEQANFLDCKINGYPKRIQWKGINLQAPNFIFIDLDLGRYKSRLALDRGLYKTLMNINQKFNVVVNRTCFLTNPLQESNISSCMTCHCLKIFVLLFTYFAVHDRTGFGECLQGIIAIVSMLIRFVRLQSHHLLLSSTS